jgi:predicted tellurium resistance membrane protein TerC
MDFALDPSAIFVSLLIPAQILFVNLLLSADNALVIAMACRGLPAEDVQRATLLGIVGAIVLRLAMGSVAIFLLHAPLVQMGAGVILLWIAVRLTLVDDSDLSEDGGETPFSGTRAVFGAVQAIGLALSIPMLIWGSNLIRELLDESGLLVLASGAFLGWVAGGVAVADPLVVAPISAYAPALSYAIPAACAIFVLWQNLILDPRRARLRGSHAE